MPHRRWTPEEKIRIVLESLNTNIGVAELCRKYAVNPVVFYAWKEKFIEGGKQALTRSRRNGDGGWVSWCGHLKLNRHGRGTLLVCLCASRCHDLILERGVAFRERGVAFRALSNAGKASVMAYRESAHQVPDDENTPLQ